MGAPVYRKIVDKIELALFLYVVIANKQLTSSVEIPAGRGVCRIDPGAGRKQN